MSSGVNEPEESLRPGRCVPGLDPEQLKLRPVPSSFSRHQIDLEGAHRTRFERQTQPLFALAKRLLGPLAFGDVSGDAGYCVYPPLRVAKSELRRKPCDRAVLELAVLLELQRPARLDHLAIVCLVPVRVLLRHELVPSLADHLLRRGVENLCDGGIGQQKAFFRIEGIDDSRRVVDYALYLPLSCGHRLLRPFPLGHVMEVDGQPLFRWVAVAIQPLIQRLRVELLELLRQAGLDCAVVVLVELGSLCMGEQVPNYLAQHTVHLDGPLAASSEPDREQQKYRYRTG